MPALEDAIAPPWKVGNEWAPYHPQASHVDPSYRDGWNAAYRAARAHLTDSLDARRYRWLRTEGVGIESLRPCGCPEDMWFASEALDRQVDNLMHADAALSEPQEAKT